MADDDDKSNSSSGSEGSSSVSPPSRKSFSHAGKSGKVEDDDSASDREDGDDNKSQSGASSSGSSHSGSGSSSDSSDQSEAENDAGKEDVDDKDDDDDCDKSREASEEDIVDDEDTNDNRSRSRSKSRSSRSGSDSEGSRSRSGSRSGSNSSHSGSQLSEGEKRRRSKREEEKFWEDNPEFYGVRRSNRPKYEAKPPKLEPEVGHKRKSSKKVKSVVKTKRRRVISDDDESSEEESTRTVRKRPTGVSYKEQESEDEGDRLTDDEDEENVENGEPEPEEHVETIEKVMESRIGKKGATGSATIRYTVEEEGDPNEKLPADTELENQFLIKWAGWSHLHNSWESLATLTEMKVKGLKKLDNFCKKEDDYERYKKYASPEDVEYQECQQELQQELVKSYINAERIIAEHENVETNKKEYFVKWEGLSYAEATWETADLLKKRCPDAIKLFKRREASNRTPSASAKCLRHRPKFTPTPDQPDFLKGDNLDLILRDYQLDGLNWLVRSWCKENSVILADEMGLGKTIQTICFLAYLFETYNLYGPYLVIVPLSTMTAWQKEFAQWAPQINVVTYLGDIASRDVIRDYEWFFPGTRKIKFNVILTTYEIVLKDAAILTTVPWACMMVDEAHRLKNMDSLLYKTLETFDSNHRLLITGTPLQNSLKELWSLLHFIMPHKFDDWETFEGQHDDSSAQKGYSKLHKQLEPFILRRVKKDVEKSLPKKVEQILRVNMTMVQKQFYKWILTKNYTALRKGVKGSVSSFVNVVMELKKCCNHASLIKPLDQFQGDTLTQLLKGSGKLNFLDKLLTRLKETGHRVLIFSQMVMMLDIIAEYLQARRFSFQRLDGTIKGDMRKQALDHFNAEGSSDFCFLLSTRAGGLGINLATADTVIIFDSDWNPQNDLQAQARAHRIGQKNKVMIYRLVTMNSVEEDIVERAKKKMVLDHLVIQRMDTTGRTVLDKGSKSGAPFNKDELSAILKFGAAELFKEDNTEGDDNCDIDEILRRAETHEEAERPGDDLLSSFKVASFSVNEDEEIPETSSNVNDSQEPKDWDQIIPEDLRKRVEAEEKEKEMADLYLPPRSSRTAGAVEKQPLGNEALNRKARNKKRKRGEKESEESESDDDGRPKKRGRPNKAHAKDGGLKGFTDAQIRKFLKSLKKFASPLTRIEKVAEDSGMVDRSIADLKKLAEQLLKGCRSAIAEQKANPQPIVPEEAEPAPAEGEEEGAKKKPNKPREKGPIFKVCGVGINARTMSIAIEELEPLGEVIPSDEASRKNWKLDLKVKNAPFDVDWGIEDDTRLLLAVWEHGMGNWDKIREADPVLKEKIFVEGDKKPLVKHASNRVDYLLRVIKKHQAIQKLKQPKIKKKREPKAKKNEEGVASAPGTDSVGTAAVTDENAIATGKGGKDSKPKGKRGRKKKDSGPMHFAAQAEPKPIAVLGELDPYIFNECKEKMRPVRKALKSLDNPDPLLPEKEQIQQTRSCLIQIGKQIEACLEEYKDKEDEAKNWKSYLWYFVSKFTEYDAKKLHKVYKKATKKDKDKEDKPNDKDRERGDKKEKGKDKEKNRKDKEKKSSRRDREETSQSSFHENSNSSFGGGYREREAKPYKQNREERDREKGGRDPRERNRGDRMDRGGRYENDRVPPMNYDTASSSAPGSSFNSGARKYPAVQNGIGSYPHEVYPNHAYRDRERERDRAPGDPRGDRRDRSSGDPRDRSSGDPRGRGGPHPNKPYYNNYERDRGSHGGNFGENTWNDPRDRDESRTGPSWALANFGKKLMDPHKEDDSRYYTAQSGRPGVPPPPPSIGGLSPFQGSNLGSRVAPPLTRDEWKRHDPRRQVVNQGPQVPRQNPTASSSANRRYERSSYE